jgi:hypothetical protein
MTPVLLLQNHETHRHPYGGRRHPGAQCHYSRAVIDARHMHPALYDLKLMKPSKLGIDYLLPIFTDAICEDDAEHMRQTLFAAGNLAQPYHSINTDVNKRIRYLEEEAA